MDSEDLGNNPRDWKPSSTGSSVSGIVLSRGAGAREVVAPALAKAIRARARVALCLRLLILILILILILLLILIPITYP